MNCHKLLKNKAYREERSEEKNDIEKEYDIENTRKKGSFQASNLIE